MQRNAQNLIPQAQLWIGSSVVLEQQVIQQVQTWWCKEGGCSQCITCTNISRKQHYGICWVAPEKNQYTKADLEPLLQRSTCLLDHNEPLIFVIQSAELLSPTCANSLLKLVEEPPQACYFIFCTQRPGLVLPTIASRCVRSTFKTDSQENCPEFLDLLKRPIAKHLLLFSKQYEAAKVTEQETSLLLDQLLIFWQKEQYKNISSNDAGNLRAQAIVDAILESYRYLPMPGSAKIFWKNIFLKLISL